MLDKAHNLAPLVRDAVAILLQSPAIAIAIVYNDVVYARRGYGDDEVATSLGYWELLVAERYRWDVLNGASSSCEERNGNDCQKLKKLHKR